MRITLWVKVLVCLDAEVSPQSICEAIKAIIYNTGYDFDIQEL
jgi:hypothetical protein